MSIQAMQFPFNKPGLIFDLDNTLATLHWYTLARQPKLTKLLWSLKSNSEAFRGIRTKHLEMEMEGLIKTSMKQIDQSAAKAYSNAVVSKSICRLISKWDEMGQIRAIVSDHRGMEKLKAIGLAEGWSAVINCREHGALKPLSDGLWAAAAQMGLGPTEVTFVGDRFDTDGLAAYEFGCQFIHVKDLSKMLPIE